MPLNPATLIDAILSITDPSRPGHVFPASQAEAAARWAAAVRRYFEEFTPTPVVLPPAIELACAAGEAAMRISLENTPDGAALVQMPTAVQAFGIAFALSLSPPPVAPPLAIPPPAPPGMPALEATRDPRPPAVALAAAIDVWARTGLSGVPPSPPSAPWS